MQAQQSITSFDRDEFVKRLTPNHSWDMIIIGGGATGLGIAVDAANRGYSTLLLEGEDFAKGTSSRSTKLIHGGVRYLAQGHIDLVFKALRERGSLLKNAAHLVKSQSFIIPCYSQKDKWKYLVGLKLYDWLSGGLSIGSSSYVSRQKVMELLPNVQSKGLVGGVEYFDSQFDDSRLAINLAQTAAANGAVVLNYCKVTSLLKTNGTIIGVVATDVESKTEYQFNSKVVVNATGIFVDDILKMDEPQRRPLVKPSQGIHLVLDRSFLKGSHALLIPKTQDGRVLFAVPWHQHLLVGTTDTPLNKPTIEPVALDEEIQFVLQTVKEYLSVAPTEKDVLSVFAGLRPLAAKEANVNSTKEISRDHKLLVNHSGLVTITGGKWTTYRRMAEDTINKIIAVGVLPSKPCKTRSLKIHGCTTSFVEGHLAVYGSDAEAIKELIKSEPLWNRKLVQRLPNTEAEVIWAIRNEMARTPEDVLARRMRILFLDALAAIEAAPRVTELIAEELNYDEEWKAVQLARFVTLAKQYLPKKTTDTNF